VIFREPGLIAASSRKPDNMSLNYGLIKEALDNRRRFLDGLNIDFRRLVCAKQTHSANIRVATEKDAGSGALSYEKAIADTDAFITRCSNLPLAVFTADCLPVFLYDPLKRSIGIVHAGWKGTHQEIASKAVALMAKEFGSAPEDILAGLGPSIRQCSYEVGGEFRDYFTYGLKEAGGKYFLDLAGINKKQLSDSGLRQENISDPGQCTFCKSSEFFSFRREAAACGRMMSVIMITG